VQTRRSLPEDAPSPIEVECGNLIVRDPGPGFNPAQVPTPVAAEQLFSHHGRGIFLISQLMDHVEFGHGGREIRVHKR
jgi:serine/threonine-protein kinase RsbW